nr:unnamed protein product [Digitaria exilis]
MEASASAPAALLPLLAALPRFLHLPLRHPSGRRHGCGSGGGGSLLLQPPPLVPSSRARCRTTCCASCPYQTDVVLGEASLVSVTACTLLAALQLVWLRWRTATHGDSPEVLHDHGKNILNKALGASKTIYESDCAAQTTRDSGLPELGFSGRKSVDELHCKSGHFAPVACLREGPVSKQKKAVKDHDGAPVTGWGISNILNKENPDNYAPTKRGRSKGAKDTLDYSRIYNSFLIDGRLKDCVDLLERMQQNGLLDMKEIHHSSFFRALQVMELLKEAGLKPDCKLYTTLISTCAKCGKVDAMFEVFHEMVSAGIEPNVNTYSALIDGCARAGQVAKAFGVYGIMSSKKVKPDRVVFNALISACGESGAVARAFDVLSEMIAESSESKGSRPILPDHVTVGVLMKTCIQADQADRAREVYKMLPEYNIKGTPEVYTIALRSCSLTGDLGFALKIYEDMNKIGVKPDEMFLSALVDVAGHARRADAAFEIMKDARAKGLHVGIIAYSSLMGACCNVLKAVNVLNEMNSLGVHPNEITYSVLFVACERNGEAQLGLDLFQQLKIDGIDINPTIVGSLTGLCLQMFDSDLSLGNIFVNFSSGKPQIDNKWYAPQLSQTSSAIIVYRVAVSNGLIPSSDVLSQVLGCLRLPHDNSLKSNFIENMGISCEISQHPNINSLFEGFGEYDIRAFSILEEAASLGAVANLEVLVGELVLVGAHGVGPHVDAVAVACALLCIAVGAREPAQLEGEHDGLVGLAPDRYSCCYCCFCSSMHPGGRRIHRGEMARRDLGAAEQQAAGAGMEPDVDALEVECVGVWPQAGSRRLFDGKMVTLVETRQKAGT